MDLPQKIWRIKNEKKRTRSSGCIAGHILGVLNGENAIPEKWRKNLREYNIVSRIADDIHTRFEENSAGHVTKDWWQKYCNKQALICNMLRTVSEIGVDTPPHKVTAVQAQVLP